MNIEMMTWVWHKIYGELTHVKCVPTQRLIWVKVKESSGINLNLSWRLFLITLYEFGVTPRWQLLATYIIFLNIMIKFLNSEDEKGIYANSTFYFNNDFFFTSHNPKMWTVILFSYYWWYPSGWKIYVEFVYYLTFLLM